MPVAASSSNAHQSRSDAQTAALPWVEKYRPSSLDDLVSQGEIVNTINRLISANRLPHLLFYGPPGTGKTSTVLAIAKKLYGPQWQSMTLEVRDHRGADSPHSDIAWQRTLHVLLDRTHPSCRCLAPPSTSVCAAKCFR